VDQGGSWADAVISIDRSMIIATILSRALPKTILSTILNSCSKYLNINK